MKKFVFALGYFIYIVDSILLKYANNGLIGQFFVIFMFWFEFFRFFIVCFLTSFV